MASIHDVVERVAVVFRRNPHGLSQPGEVTTFIDRPAPSQAGAAAEGEGMSTRANYAAAVEEFQRKLRRSQRIYGAAALILLVAMAGVLGEGYRIGSQLGQGKIADDYEGGTAVLAVMALVMLAIRVNSTDVLRRRIRIAQHVVDVLDEEQGRVAVAEETVDLDSLLKTNRTLLKQYHSISTEQAQEAFKMARLVVAVAGVVFLLACMLALRGETVIGVSLAGAAVIASGVGGWVARTFLESYRISVSQAEAYFREPMVQGYLLAAHQIAQTMETPSARDEGLSRVMDGFLAAGLECARSRSSALPSAHPES